MTSSDHNSIAIYRPWQIWRRALGLVWQAVPLLTICWLALLVLLGLLPGAVVYLSKLTIDSFVQLGSDPDQTAAFERAVLFLVLTGICLVLVEALQYLTDWVRNAQAEYFADYLKNRIHSKSAAIDVEYYESPEYHDLLEQVRTEAQSKPLALLENLGAVVQSGITIIIFSTILLSYGWAIPLLLIVGSIPALYFALRYDRIYHSWWKASANSRRWLNYFDAMLTHPNAAAEMRLFGLGNYFQKKYGSLRRRLRDERLSHLRKQYAAKGFAAVISLLAAVIALGWVAQRVFYGLSTVGDIVVFYHVFSRGQGLMRSFLGGFGQTVNNGLYIESLFSFLDLGSKVGSPQNPTAFPKKICQGVHFRDVTFSYPRETRTAINDLDLHIPVEKVIAIVGVNGAGKSTLIKLLSRFYDVQKGKIEIDGIDIRNFDLEELRRNTSVLFQFPVQFHETAGGSIALGNEGRNGDQDEIESAAIHAGAHDFIRELPDGYETLLGKWFVRGTELSGGQWQRVALARAYFRKAQIIILDEPTSFMDPWSETDWFDRFRSIVGGRCGVIITHRFTIARRADLIYVVDGGRVVEKGTHDELLQLNGFYAASWNDQQNLQASANPETQGFELASTVETENLHTIVTTS